MKKWILWPRDAYGYIICLQASEVDDEGEGEEDDDAEEDLEGGEEEDEVRSS